MIPERIDDHCFEPRADLRDECAYFGCGKSELLHFWTVEAYKANPDFPSRETLIKLANRLEADNKALLEALKWFVGAVEEARWGDARGRIAGARAAIEQSERQ